MERVVITIEGTTEEVLKALHGLQGNHEAGKEKRIGWLPDEIEDFFNTLQPEARRILKEIATKPDGYGRDDLLSKLGLSARALAGHLSSVGHTLRRYYPAKPRPIELDWATWEYTMLPEVAEWIIESTTAP